ncbi:hypothetical protein SAMN06269185_1078 [Natronoarchaeum philippinense]|uniref:Uncharacterized protein n=1 Tax=Natronoarchaeum philippinense TaxID=558529 RepID=A0A285N9P1_NATPI|nr:hypothetical protein [Natronoarchaeum philippinense]SNZ06185.1 hypothetical protein SAMN06269185_1078 [Natronoarchaeum philippinense]
MSRSTDAPADDRDLEAEAAEPEAGHSGIPFDAVCVGCGQRRVKRCEQDPEDLTSFKHVCHECQSGTWWNPVQALPDLDGDAA